jgi:hypothetical protein
MKYDKGGSKHVISKIKTLTFVHRDVKNYKRSVMIAEGLAKT